jgi:hypothetical protein
MNQARNNDHLLHAGDDAQSSASNRRICGATSANRAVLRAGNWSRSRLLLGHASFQTTERYLGVKQDLVHAPNDRIGVRWHGWRQISNSPALSWNDSQRKAVAKSTE